MSWKDYAIIKEVKKETDKAILVKTDEGEVWLPKSKVRVHKIPKWTALVVEMPHWLWRQHSTAFELTTDKREVYETTGYML